MDYWAIKKALETKDKNKFLFTVEFFPEEGKYHFDGHRACGVRLDPRETKKNNGLCPKCKKPLTLGVMYRVEELADRPIGFVPETAIPYKSMVPLDEIIAEAFGVAKTSKAVAEEYLKCVTMVAPEFYILGKMPEEELFKKLSEKIALGIKNVREGKVEALAGYDGEYGVIKVLNRQKETPKPADSAGPDKGEQLMLF
jgi:PHP family Zn ribbon phosphoesterase